MRDTAANPRRLSLSGLLTPRAIAVIGASDKPGNLGAGAISHLQRLGYRGGIYPVNPRLESLAGVRCYGSVSEVPFPVDLALLAVSGERLLQAVRECAAVGIRAGVAWAGGFAEAGPDGQALQAALVQICHEENFSLCGPNCIGIINNHNAMTATFGSSLLGLTSLKPGHISMVSQSGGIASFVHALAEQAGVGFGTMVSTGNEAVLTTADFVEALADDSTTRVICIYLEGLKDGNRFVAALQRARARGKQVVVIKAGATPASASAALAHTGALAGEDRVWDAVLRECGAIRANSLEELVDIALYLQDGRAANFPQGKGMAVISFGGGGGVLAADQGAAVGMETPPLTAASRALLLPLVPPIASIANPFDLTPDAYNKPKWFAKFPDAVRVIATDPNVHTLFFQLGAIAHKADAIIDMLIELAGDVDQAICVAWPLPPPTVLKRLPEAGIHVFSDAARGLRVMGKLATVSAHRSSVAAHSSDPRFSYAWDGMSLVSDGSHVMVSEDVCHRVMARAGLPIARGTLCTDAVAARIACKDLGFPVAVKGLSGSVSHKAASGLVVLGVDSMQALDNACACIMANASKAGSTLDGIYVQQMIEGAGELIVSAFRDPVFGVMVSCGAGGAMTEMLNDVALHRAPVDAATAHAMLGQLKVVRRLSSAQKTLSVFPAAEFVADFSQLTAQAPLEDFVFEVNPIKWRDAGVVAVDGLLTLG
jgi:acyl-CoA synthetase (NDP forming)